MIYDSFQENAIGHIKNNDSVIVSAPTGSGKTVIAEYVINDCLSRNKGVIYTAPIKALSNQKYRDFQESFVDKIGILTGDVSINSQAPVLIMTTEIFRNKVLEGGRDLERYSWIIFDEIHYLDDYERGTVWEESLIFLPKHMNILALSATIPNIDEFASWIHSIHKKPLRVVKETNRPVPLHFYYQCRGEIVDSLNKVKKIGYGRDYMNPRDYRSARFHQSKHFKPNRPDILISHLKVNDRLPCIYFCFDRRRCEYLAHEMLGFNFLTQEEEEKISGFYERLLERFDLRGEKSAEILFSLVEKGIAYHHAGMLPTLKEVVEQLFTSRLIKVIFTTETFALGINMPARTVIFDELRKFYGQFFGTLKNRDFYQMAGRAGRRGIDKEGFVYSRVNPHFTRFNELHNVIYGNPEEVRSKFNVSYATILNLYDKFGEKLYGIYPDSFHYYQQKDKKREKAVTLMRAKVDMLKSLGYIENGLLTDKGRFADKIYGYELSLSELYSEGVLEKLNEIELGILCLALVFEPRKRSVKPPLNKRVKEIAKITEDLVERIQKSEKKAGIVPLSKNYHFHLTPCLEAWMNKHDFDTIMRLSSADEGEIIRYFRMTIQILREILDTPASEDLKKRIKNSVALINRGIIDAEKQLRE